LVRLYSPELILTAVTGTFKRSYRAVQNVTEGDNVAPFNMLPDRNRPRRRPDWATKGDGSTYGRFMGVTGQRDEGPST